MQLRCPVKSTLGFTLIEVVVVIAVLSAMTVSITPSFTNYLKSQQVKQTQETLKSDMRLMQNKAVTGVLNAEGATYWVVQFFQMGDTAQYTMFATDETAATFDEVCPGARFIWGTTTESVMLEDGILFDETELVGSGPFGSSVGCAFFSLSGGDILTYGIATAGSDTTYKITVSKDSNSNSICFNTGGLIYTPEGDTCD